MNRLAKILFTLPLLGGCTNVRTFESKAPACSNPARLEGHADARAPGVFVAFKPGVEPVGAAERLIQKYHFRKAIQYSWGAIFSSDLDLELIPLIRCEPDGEYLEFNQLTTIASASAVTVPKPAAEASAPPQVTISYDAGTDLCSVSDSTATSPLTMRCEKVKDYVREHYPPAQDQP